LLRLRLAGSPDSLDIDWVDMGLQHRLDVCARRRSLDYRVQIDVAYTGKQATHEAALPEIQKHVERLDKLQYL
jgi:hypothetical protein